MGKNEVGICKSTNIKLAGYKDKNRTFLGHDVATAQKNKNKIVLSLDRKTSRNNPFSTCGIE